MAAAIKGQGSRILSARDCLAGPAPGSPGFETNDQVRALKDIDAREMLMLSVLAIAVLVMGLWPRPVTDVSEASVRALLQHVAVSKVK